jgi:hypothetical protein
MVQMPVDFIDFRSSCESRGYEAVDQRASIPSSNIFAMRTRNGIKVEIKVTRSTPFYVAGHGLNDYKLNFLKSELESKNMVILQQMAKFLKVEISANVLEGFWTLVDIIENIEELIQRQRASRFYQAEYNDNVFMYVANDIANMIKYKPPGSPWSRGKVFDDIDSMVTLGYSAKGKMQERNGKAAYREHIVPIDWCITKAFEMLQNGHSIEDVAQMFKRNIKVVLISDEEQDLLDNKLGLRTTMPEGFVDGNDPLTRLKYAGILLENNA